MKYLLGALSLLVSTTPLVGQEPGLVDDVPSGTNWVADARTRTYYPVGCPITLTIAKADRLFYGSEASLKSAGFTKGEDCDRPQAPAQVPPLGAAAERQPETQPQTPQAPETPKAPEAPKATSPDLPRRNGFWFNGGLGYGSLGCEDCGGREGGLSGTIGIGGTVSQKVLLGITSNGWTKNEGGVTLTVGTLTGMIRFYPAKTGRFFLIGGLGIGSIYAEIDGFGSDTETGAGALLGLGYDFRVGDNTSLTAYWNGFAASTENADANVGQIGLSITAH